MRASERNGRSKRGWKWLVFGCVCLALFVLRHNIAGFAVDAALRRVFSSEQGASFAYADVHWDGHTISIDELDIETPEYRLAIQRLELNLEISFSSFQVFPHVWIVRPYVIFRGSELPETGTTLAAPFGLIHWVKLDIVEGRCEWIPRPDASPEELFLQFVSDATPNALGTLELFATPEMNQPPLIRAILADQIDDKRGLFISWESQDLATQHLLPLVWTVVGHSVSGWERMEGGWDLRGSLALDEKGIVRDLQSYLTATNLELRNATLGLHVAARNISLNLQQLLPDQGSSASPVPWYQRIEAHAVIEEGEIECTEPLAEHPWGITHLDGHMSWCEKEDPIFSLNGVTIQEDGERELFIQGTGSLGNEHSFWLQSHVTWGAKEKPLLETSLSLCSPDPTSLVVEAQVSDLQVNALTSLVTLFGWPHRDLENVQFNQGKLKGTVTAWMENERFERIEIREGGFEDIGCHGQSWGEAEGITGSLEGSWRNLPTGWTNNHLMITFRSDEITPNLVPQFFPVFDVEGECVIEGDKIIRATAKGRLDKIPFHCACEGTLEKYRLLLNADTTLGACLETFELASTFDPESAKKIGLQFRLEGSPHVQEGTRAFGSIFVKNGDELAKEISLDCAWTSTSDLIPKGKIRAHALPVAVGLPFFKKYLPETKCNGSFDLDGVFDEKGMELHVDIPRLEIATSLLNIELLSQKEKRTRGIFTMEWDSEEFQFLLPLVDARCTLPSLNLSISQVRAMLELKKNQALFKDLQANCEGVALQGQLRIGESGISLHADKIKGRFESLEIIFAKALRRQYQPIGISGDFSTGAEGLLFEAPLDLSSCSTLAFQGSFSSLRIPLHKEGCFEEIFGAIAYDSRQRTLKFSETRGLFTTPKGEFSWIFHPTIFNKAEEHWEGMLDASLAQHQLEMVRLISCIRLSGSSFGFAVDPRQSHVLGCPIEKAKGVFTPEFCKYQCHVNWDLEQIPALQDLLSDLTIVRKEDLPTNEFFKKVSSGHVRAQLDYDSTLSLFQFNLEGKQINLFDTACSTFRCQGKKLGQLWKFTECRWDDHKLQFDLYIRNFELAVPTFAATIAGFELQGSATCSLTKREWQCQLPSLQIPVGKQSIKWQAKQPIIIDYSDANRCLVKNITLEEAESRSQIACPTIQIDWVTKTLLARNIQHRLTPRFTRRLLPSSVENVAISPDHPLDGTLQIDASWQDRLTYQVQGVWKECPVRFKDKVFTISQLNGRYREGALLLGGKTTIGQLPAIASLQIDHTKETLGVFKIQENPQDSGLSLFFRILPNGSIEPSHINGEFAGLKPTLRKKGPQGVFHLQGTIGIDFNKVRNLFPRDAAPPWQSLQLGRGFTFDGDLLYQNEKLGVQGEMRGERCELLGYNIQDLTSLLTLEPTRLKFEKFQIADPALSLAIRKLTLEETSAGKIWTLSCPSLQIREFQPSRMKKIGKPMTAEKPFIIRNLTFTNLMGDINNPKSFSGECSLHFTNAEKKEASLFDAPLDFLKDVGLEPSVLVPVQGELDGRFEEGRLLFTALKGSYSEGQRTQFILSDRGEGSYIDFQGNLHINLAVKQAVLLKIAESLTLGIRGSVEKPRYIILP